jgi:hypothetical protein
LCLSNFIVIARFDLNKLFLVLNIRVQRVPELYIAVVARRDDQLRQRQVPNTGDPIRMALKSMNGSHFNIYWIIVRFQGGFISNFKLKSR